MELEDLAKHETEFVTPISYTYNDEVTVYEVCSYSSQSHLMLTGNLAVST